MEIKLFVASEIQYFELGIVSFNLFIYYQTRGFIAQLVLLILQLLLLVF